MMKKLLMTCAALLLAACGGEAPPEQTAAPAAIEASSGSEAAVEASAPETAIVEYVWHKKGENFSDEALAELAAYWAGIIDEGDIDMNAAVVVTPRFDSDNFDFIWVMLWPSQEARDQGWAVWTESYEAGWAERIDGIFSYSVDSVFPFAPTPGRAPSVPNTAADGVSEYMFCTLAEGRTMDDVMAFGAEHNAFVDQWEANDGAGGYWWAILTPNFTVPEEGGFDYAWFNGWTNEAERQAGWAAYSQSPHAALVAENGSCTDPAVFDGQVIYTRPSA